MRSRSCSQRRICCIRIATSHLGYGGGTGPTSCSHVLVQGRTVSIEKADRDLPKEVHCDGLSQTIRSDHTCLKSEVCCKTLSLAGFDSESVKCYTRGRRRMLPPAYSSGECDCEGSLLTMHFSKQKLLTC